MKKYLFIVVIILAALSFFYFYSPDTVTQSEVSDDASGSVEETNLGFISYLTPKDNVILLEKSLKNELIASPLRLTGQVRGYWFFEASFPITLTNWDGLIIAEGYAKAEGDWMTTDFVPFSTVLEFENPYKKDSPDFMQKGTLILHRDNPSGLPQNDDALEIPIQFKAED